MTFNTIDNINNNHLEIKNLFSIPSIPVAGGPVN